jgi:hypothetical protein
LQVEQLGGVVGIAKDIGGGLVDRHLPRPGGRVGGGAGVNLQSVEGIIGHGWGSLKFAGP